MAVEVLIVLRDPAWWYVMTSRDLHPRMRALLICIKLYPVKWVQGRVVADVMDTWEQEALARLTPE